MIDEKLIGETAAALMDSLDDDEFSPEAKIVEVGLVIIIDDPRQGDGPLGGTLTRCRCSSYEQYRQIGVFDSALAAVRDPDVSD